MNSDSRRSLIEFIADNFHTFSFLRSEAEECEMKIQELNSARSSLLAAKERHEAAERSSIDDFFDSKFELDAAKDKAKSLKEEATKARDELASATRSLAAKGMPVKGVVKCLHLYHNKREEEKLLEFLKAAQTLDLCFVIDATGSMHMDKVFQSLKEKISTIITEIGELNPYLQYQLGLVAYRDPEDGAKHIECLPFTTNRTEFEQKAADMVCSGGGDTCEDVVGGLQCAANMKWQFQNRILFLCGDAPCHGMEYHRGEDDRHPKGLGVPSAGVIRQLVELGVLVYYWKINNSTDKMIVKFNDEAAATRLPFPEGRSNDTFIESIELDTTSTDTITRSVKDSITDSITSSMTKSVTRAAGTKSMKISNAVKALTAILEAPDDPVGCEQRSMISASDLRSSFDNCTTINTSATIDTDLKGLGGKIV